MSHRSAILSGTFILLAGCGGGGGGGGGSTGSNPTSNSAGSPNLGSLQGNGGLLTPIIPTIASNAGSGLISAIPLATCVAMATVDERMARGYGAPTYPNCTIGAYEYP